MNALVNARDITGMATNALRRAIDRRWRNPNRLAAAQAGTQLMHQGMVNVLAPRPTVPTEQQGALEHAANQQHARAQMGLGPDLGGTVTPQMRLLAENVDPSLMAAKGGKLAAALGGMLAGVGAKTADQRMLKIAEGMARAGKSRKEIWDKTGWYKGVDDKWRFEIDDTAAQFNEAAYRKFRRMREGSEMPLAELLPHAELSTAYPHYSPGDPTTGYRDAIARRGVSGLEGGSASPSGFDYVNLNTGYQGPAGDMPDMRSTALHESQHMVQGREGFASGGDSSTVPPPKMPDSLKRELAAMKERWRSLPGGSPERAALVNKGISMEAPYTPYGTYRRLAGEAEARNVQRRMDMTPEERKATPPWETLDVPEEELIVRHDRFGNPLMVSWHGGPHKWAPEPGFPKGRPRLDKIGTGEGAQAYGHGFYSAEEKVVGGEYKKMGDARWSDIRVMDDQIKSMKEFIEFDSLGKTGPTPRGKMMADKVTELEKKRAVEIERTGSLYKLDIPDADVAKFLDWDAPLSEQGPAILELAETYGVAPTADGGTLTSAMERALGKVGASSAFRRAGIPGNKYFDQMSRQSVDLFLDGKIVNPLGARHHATKEYNENVGRLVSRGTGYVTLDKSAAEIAEVMKREAKEYGIPQKDIDAAMKFMERVKPSPKTRNYVIWDQDVLDRTKMLEDE